MEFHKSSRKRLQTIRWETKRGTALDVVYCVASCVSLVRRSTLGSSKVRNILAQRVLSTSVLETFQL